MLVTNSLIFPLSKKGCKNLVSLFPLYIRTDCSSIFISNAYRADRDVFICTAYFKVFPTLSDSFTLSLPAKSTKHSLLTLPPGKLICNVIKPCPRDDRLLIFCSPTLLFSNPMLSSWYAYSTVFMMMLILF